MLNPPTHASPLSGLNIPVNIEIRVVFPAPLGPKSPNIYPLLTIKLKDLTAMCYGLSPTPLYTFLNPRQCNEF